MALIRCRECGQVISDKAERCPRCGCPSIGGRATYQGPDTSSNTKIIYKKENNSNKLLYGIIAFLLAVLVGGAILWFTMSNRDHDVQQPAGQIAQQGVQTTAGETGQDQQKQAGTVQEVVPVQQVAPAQQVVPQQQPVQQTYVPADNIVLNGILNGDNVTFVLAPTGPSSVSGQFYNRTINVSFAVKGEYTDDGMNLRSVNHGKWRFVASNYGGVLQGYASNGSVTYDMSIQ
ncbi:MAG: hypothetical protein J5548_15305 [Prevotella sp.]|nr:hypothetical protein [Prevotella sp.]